MLISLFGHGWVNRGAVLERCERKHPRDAWAVGAVRDGRSLLRQTFTNASHTELRIRVEGGGRCFLSYQVALEGLQNVRVEVEHRGPTPLRHVEG